MKLLSRSERLKQLRAKKGLSQRDAAELLGIPFGTYGGYEHKDSRKIKLPILEKLANFYDTTVEYIEQGDNSMVNKKGPVVIFVDRQINEERIAFVPFPAQAGYVKNYNEAEYLKQLPTYNLPGFNNGTFRMFPVEGDSMKPTFNEGDILICEYIEHYNQIKDNDCYVIVSTEGICIKRCINAVIKRQAIIIESDNPEYKPDLIPIELVLEIWHYRARLTKY